VPFKIYFTFINKIIIDGKELHEQYEYARRRIKQKKGLYFHFVVFVLGSLMLFIANKFFKNCVDSLVYLDNYNLVVPFYSTFYKIFITDRFMNKNWEESK
jgi:hypothetical protein